MEPKIRLLRYTQGKQWNTKGRARGAEGEDEEEEEQESGMIQDRWGDSSRSLQMLRGIWGMSGRS